MSHKGARKSHNSSLTEEKEKRPAESPLKEMKKKIAANAEKEKQTVDKMVTSPERSDKTTEKVAEKPQNEKNDSKKANAEKVDKNAPTPDKNAQKPDKNAEKTDKNSEKEKTAEKADKKIDKTADKKVEKTPDKKVEKPVEKKNESEKKDEGKADGKDRPEKGKTNGAANGDANGTDTVSEVDSSEEDLLVIDDQDEFPELTYDDTSDVDYEEGAPSRSFTRRSQVKATKTPETPRPASGKEDDVKASKTPETPRPASSKEDDSKEKLLKMNDPLATDRKLRSADSPKPESKKVPETKKALDSPKTDKTIDLTDDEEKKETDKNKEGNEKYKEGNQASEEAKSAAGKNQLEMDVLIELEPFEESRAGVSGRVGARVSPYTRARAHAAPLDRTATSLLANYTGNNTTMEMDITETSSVLEETNLDDSSYLRGLRTIKGRTSYKPLKELSLKHTLNRSARSNTSAGNMSVSESARPTGTVVGRKRKPDADEPEPELEPAPPTEELLHAHNKRMRLFERFAVPFRGFNTHRAAEIVGINTDLPLTAPVASTSTFDPETLKPSPSDPVAVPLPAPVQDRDSKRCLIM